MNATKHIPVLFQEVLTGLHCQYGGIFLDCTVGCGGHSKGILEQHQNNQLIGLDRDASALQVAAHQLQAFKERCSLYHQRFENFEEVLHQIYPDTFEQSGQSSGGVDGILFDLGVSSLQLDTPERGFSFQTTGPLDMRMDREGIGATPTQTAYDIIHTYSEEQLATIFFRYGEERHSRRIARKILETRALHPIKTTTELAELVKGALPKRFHPKHIHPATRVFQALRIEVNVELRQLGQTLERAVDYLRDGGRICVISFHSLEDRIVKHTFASLAKGCQCPPDFPQCVCGRSPMLQLLSRKPIIPSNEEQAQNPRSRSAKLRVAQRI